MKTIFYLLVLGALGFGGFKYYELNKTTQSRQQKVSKVEEVYLEGMTKADIKRLDTMPEAELDKVIKAGRRELAKMAVSYYKSVKRILSQVSGPIDDDSLQKEIRAVRRKLSKGEIKKCRLRPSDEKECEAILKKIKSKFYIRSRNNFYKHAYYKTFIKNGKLFKEWYKSRFVDFPQLEAEFGKAKE